MDNLLTPREAAKDLISVYVERGDSLESLRAGYQGTSGEDYYACIGGYVGEFPNLKKVSNDKIVVSRIGSQKIEPQIFSLVELFNEIKLGVKQVALF